MSHDSVLHNYHNASDYALYCACMWHNLSQLVGVKSVSFWLMNMHPQARWDTYNPHSILLFPNSNHRKANATCGSFMRFTDIQHQAAANRQRSHSLRP